MRTPARAAEGDVAVVQAGDGSDRAGSAGAALGVVPTAVLLAVLLAVPAADGWSCREVAEVQPVQMSAMQIDAVRATADAARVPAFVAVGRMPA